MDRNLQLLGIAKKAGLLAIGGDDVNAAARAGKAKLIICAADASDGALRRARSNADTGKALSIIVPFTKFELGNMTRRGSPVTVAFLDIGLAARFLEGLAVTYPGRYNEAEKLLTEKAAIAAERKKIAPSGKRRTAQ